MMSLYIVTEQTHEQRSITFSAPTNKKDSNQHSNHLALFDNFKSWSMMIPLILLERKISRDKLDGKTIQVSPKKWLRTSGIFMPDPVLQKENISADLHIFGL